MVDATPLRVGVGGPVGSGKTALLDALCKALRERYQLAVVTNDIYTREDAEFLIRSEALPAERIVGVETGGCPHTAIREDASMNLAAVDDLQIRFPDLDLVFIESGGDNLAATFSPELADLTIYVIDVAEGEKIPRKGWTGHHPFRPPGHQQNRSGALRGCIVGGHGARLQTHARGAAVRLHESAHRRGTGENPPIHRASRDAWGLNRVQSDMRHLHSAFGFGDALDLGGTRFKRRKTPPPNAAPRRRPSRVHRPNARPVQSAPSSRRVRGS